MRALTSGLATLALALALAAPASAGIIVTEGKIASQASHVQVKARQSCAPGACAEGGTATPVPSGTATASDRDTVPPAGSKAGMPVSQKGGQMAGPEGGSADLDGPPPEGWTCQRLTAGVEYCEPAQGAAPGAGGAGAWTAEAMTSEELAGCGGGSSTGHGLSGLLALALLGLRRRRT